MPCSEDILKWRILILIHIHRYTRVRTRFCLKRKHGFAREPHQTRPLGINTSDFPQPEPLLETLLKSLKGELSASDAASEAQMGAFFAAMTLRAYFPKATQWSPAEQAAFRKYRSALTEQLPPENSIPHEPCARLRPSESDRGNRRKTR